MAQLGRIRSKIKELEDANPLIERIPRLAVLHHHLLPVNNWDWGTTKKAPRPTVTLDATDVLRELDRLGVRLVLHGHRHQPAILSLKQLWRGTTALGSSLEDFVVISAGSCGHVPEPDIPHRQFFVYDIQGRIVRIRSFRTPSAMAGLFELDPVERVVVLGGLSDMDRMKRISSMSVSADLSSLTSAELARGAAELWVPFAKDVDNVAIFLSSLDKQETDASRFGRFEVQLASEVRGVLEVFGTGVAASVPSSIYRPEDWLLRDVWLKNWNLVVLGSNICSWVSEEVIQKICARCGIDKRELEKAKGTHTSHEAVYKDLFLASRKPQVLPKEVDEVRADIAQMIGFFWNRKDLDQAMRQESERVLKLFGAFKRSRDPKKRKALERKLTAELKRLAGHTRRGTNGISRETASEASQEHDFGAVIRAASPFNPDKKILLAFGVHEPGTYAAPAEAQLTLSERLRSLRVTNDFIALFVTTYVNDPARDMRDRIVSVDWVWVADLPPLS